jgi:hypothetical protein
MSPKERSKAHPTLFLTLVSCLYKPMHLFSLESLCADNISGLIVTEPNPTVTTAATGASHHDKAQFFSLLTPKYQRFTMEKPPTHFPIAERIITESIKNTRTKNLASFYLC